MAFQRRGEDPLADAFDPDHFRELGHALIDQLGDYLAAVRDGLGPVSPAQTPEEAQQFWQTQLEESNNDPSSFIAHVLKRTFRSHHPRNLGHQVGPVLPHAALFEAVSSLLDTGNGIFEVGNPGTPMERVVLMDLARRLGLPPSADGVLTSGGSLGNLTALLAMRQCRTKTWNTGTQDIQYAVMVSEEAHYCIDRAVKIMGWGSAGVVQVPVDQDYRMRSAAMESTLSECSANGIEVLGVVASAGSTSTGKIDPLHEVADFCQKHELWLHVDAAHAGAFIFSRKAKGLLAGIERADSLVLDFHKMLLSPSLLTAVLFRRSADSYQTFAQQANYLWQADHSEEWWNAAKRTMECTRPMLGLRAYAILKHGGPDLFEVYIDKALAATRIFAELLQETDDFEILTEPESNIICYRYLPSAGAAEESDALNNHVRRELIEQGKFFIVQVKKNGRTYLRSALMHPHISREILVDLMTEIRTLARGSPLET
jgi:L-2,4-diaminobutyrate decarboxylase